MHRKTANKLIDSLREMSIALIPIAFVIYYFSKKTRIGIVIVGGILVLILVAVVIAISQRRRFGDIYHWHGNRDMLNKLRSLHPDEFESFISDLFSKLGFQTETVGGRNDGGIDVVAIKDGRKHFIQCKRYSTKQIGVGAVRDFYGAIADNLSNAKGYFITTNKFTLEAEQFAEDKPIELIDGYQLMEYIRQAKIEEVPESSKPTIRVCPSCRSELVLRRGKNGQFYGCSSYPKCRHTENLL